MWQCPTGCRLQGGGAEGSPQGPGRTWSARCTGEPLRERSWAPAEQWDSPDRERGHVLHGAEPGVLPRSEGALSRMHGACRRAQSLLPSAGRLPTVQAEHL